MSVLVAYLALGACAGTLAGLLGIGGGLVIVPVLFYLFQIQEFASEITMHLAIGSSLATVIFTAIASSYAHHRRGAVHWRAVAGLAPGIVLGALLGAMVADHLPTNKLRVFFGLFELVVAVQIGLGIIPAAKRKLPSRIGMAAAGSGIGSVSSILGIGGGTLTVPFLIWCNVAIREAIATSAACGLPIALAGTIGFMVTGWGNVFLPNGSSGYIYWPATLGIVVASTLFAPLGARLAHTLPIMALKRIFALLLIVIGLRMLV